MVDADASAGAQALAKLKNANPSSIVRFDCCDVTNPEAVRHSMKACMAAYSGKLTLVVNNAGMSSESNVVDHFNLNAVSVIRATQCALDVMRLSCDKAETGCIINVSSAAGVFPLDGAPIYTASKHAVVGFTRCFAFKADAPDYVKVCALCPGFTDTPMLDKILGSPSEKRRVLETVGVMNPSEVAEALQKIICDPATASGSVLYLSASIGMFDPFATQIQMLKAAVRAHRDRHARL